MPPETDEPSLPIDKVLEIDEHNVGESRNQLEADGLMDLLVRVSQLFDSVHRELEAALRDSGERPYVRTNDAGEEVAAWDFFLRLFMLQSAAFQYLHALSHLLRGHGSEVFGHARTMIENAGVAYLAKTEPDLGELYRTGSSSYKGRTSRANILPKDDGLTAQLNTMYDRAGSLFHSNFVAIAPRLATEFSTADGNLDFSTTLKFHDVDADDSAPFVRTVLWLLRASLEVLRLFASALGLPDCVWYRRLERLEADASVAMARLAPEIIPPGSPPSES